MSPVRFRFGRSAVNRRSNERSAYRNAPPAKISRSRAKASLRVVLSVASSSDAPEHLATGYGAVDRLLAGGPPPRALFCPSDLIAYGADDLGQERRDWLRCPD